MGELTKFSIKPNTRVAALRAATRLLGLDGDRNFSCH
jgi:hypothetical protein